VVRKKKKAELVARLARLKREIKRLSNEVRALKTVQKIFSSKKTGQRRQTKPVG
jgi:hypothetical protein